MKVRTLGTRGPVVSAIGLGCMTMTGGYSDRPDRDAMIALLRSAVEQGVTFFDTAPAGVTDFGSAGSGWRRRRA